MLLWRLWRRPDRQFVVAALGIAFALLLPVAGTLVLQGLEPTVAKEEWIAYRADGAELPPGLPIASAIRFETENGVAVGAFVVGPARVAIDQAANDETGSLRTRTTTLSAPLLPPGVALVHPDTLTGTAPHVALLTEHAAAPGVVVAPARGPDAFEAAGLEALQSQTIILVLASVPAVALVAVAFGDHEARARARSAATLAALGRPNLGRRILALRFLWLMTWATTFAALLGFLLWRFGGAAFHPRDTQPLGVFAAIAVPAALGGLLGLIWAIRRLGDGNERLRTPPAEHDAPGRRLGWLPVLVRPIALGTRLLPLLLIAGVLFGINLGFPIAAASVPAAIAGGPGEWVLGSDGGITFGGEADARPAAVMALDPAIDAIIAERLLPTLLNGEPVLIRGGDLPALAAYHGAIGVGGAGLWVGERLAQRLDIGTGDVVRVQGTQPMVASLVVEGIYRGGGVLADEALLDNDAAGGLTGHAPGEATVVRMRPDTEEAREALSRTKAVIEVLDVRYQGTPATGAPLTIEIDVVNLGGAAGTRPLPVRINDVVQATPVATLGPYGQATVQATVIVPAGSFDITVNPTVAVQPTASSVSIQAPRIVFLPDLIPVTVDSEGQVELRNGTTLIDVAALVDGQATLNASLPGRYTITHSGVSRNIIVSPDAYRNTTVLAIDALWTTPHQPIKGEVSVLHAAVTNLGALGTAPINITRDGEPFVRTSIQLIAGQSKTIDFSFIYEDIKTLGVNGETYVLDAAPTRSSLPVIDAQKSSAVQAKVADRVLGDAQTALVGLATIALGTILTVVYLGTERTLQGRAHVPRVLHALGMQPEEIRYRAAWEAALLAGLAFLVSALGAKIVFRILGAIGWPAPFAHTMPDPITLLFVTQAGAAFAGIAALAAYLAAGKIVKD